MRTLSDEYIAVGLGLFIALALAYGLYRPRVQQSEQYQATVVPLANIMDVGFIFLSPAIVLLAGFTAPLAMLGICLLAIATGFVEERVGLRYKFPLRHHLTSADPVDNRRHGRLSAIVIKRAFGHGYGR